MEWEGGDNLLGPNASIWFDNETGFEGCVDGLIDAVNAVGSCQNSWRFFNIDGASKYKLTCVRCY